MQPVIFLLFLSACSSHVPAQPDTVGNSASPARQMLPDKSTMPSADMPCPHCSPSEQLVVDLIYYRQVLEIVEQISQQRTRIDAGLLRSIHAELKKTRPQLAALLTADAGSRAPAVPPAKKAEKPLKRPDKPAKEPVPRKGIEGLAVGHVNEENKDLGIKSSVVLISNGRPRSLNTGSTIEHNKRIYKIHKVIYVEDPNKGNRHEVHLQEQNSKKIHIVPWK